MSAVAVSEPMDPRGPARRCAWLGVTVVLALVLIAPASAHAIPSPLGSALVPGPASKPASLATPVASTVLSPSAPDWTTFHGTENRSGYTSVAGPSRADPAWPAPYCVAAPARLDASPVANATRVFDGDSAGTIFALNRAAQGAVLWTQSLHATPGTADLSGPYLIVGRADGVVTALWASNGTVAWNASVGSSVMQGVAVANGTVLVGTQAGFLVALALPTGAFDWSRNAGAAIRGAPAVEGPSIYVATAAGQLVRYALNGSWSWNASVGRPVVTAPAVSNGTVVVGDTSGNVSAFFAGNGTLHWRTPSRAAFGGDSVNATPAIGGNRVYVQSFRGEVSSLDLASGRVVWNRSVPSYLLPVTSSPAATPSGVYLFGADENLYDLAPSDGHTLWSTSFAGEYAYSSPALDRGTLFLGDAGGCLHAIGPPFTLPTWSVTGEVRAANGTAIGGASVDANGFLATSRSDGGFELNLTNGSYALVVEALEFAPYSGPLRVSGPTSNVLVVLNPWYTYRLSGFVRDAASGHGLPGLRLDLFGFLYHTVELSGPNGSFALAAPNGSDFLTVNPPPGFPGLALHVSVHGAPVAGLLLAIEPKTLPVTTSDRFRLELWLPLAAIAVALATMAVWNSIRLRSEQGLPVGIVSRFGQFVAMRVALIPAQAAVGLVVLYVFGSFLPYVARSRGSCATAGCLAPGFFRGLGTYLFNIFTGNWGIVRYGNLKEPATLFLQWWLPDSIELAVISLAIAAAVAYPLGLIAGWRPEGAVDTGARLGSLVGLLFPSFVLVLLALGALYLPFLTGLGDPPYQTLPTAVWFSNHGGFPPWLGLGGNTTPTGFPLVDGAYHGAWGFEAIVAAKALFQASIIAVVYLAIFLRYARTVVAETAAEPHIGASRSRGVPESSLLWRHTARRVQPVFLLIFGLTLPIFIGTQALVEALFNANGVGTLLLIEMTQVATTGFGFSTTGGNIPMGNFYQVSIFLMLLLVLFGNLGADILAWRLDPRLAHAERSS